MSGWGFAYGAGKAAFDVADTRIKDRLEQQREKRAREATMELERYKTGIRREETAEERTYLGQQAETRRSHELSLQKMKGQQAMQVQKAKGKTGTGTGKQAWEVIESQDPATGQTSYLQHNKITGEIKPYQPEGMTADPQAIERQWADYSSAKFGTWASEKELRAAAKELGLPEKEGDYHSREEIEYHFKQQQGGYMTGAPVPEKPAPKPTSAKPQPISPAAPTEPAAGQITDTERESAMQARKSRPAMESFMRERGASEPEIAAAGAKYFPETAETPTEGPATKATKPEAQAAISARQREARSWANKLTEARARKQFKTGPALNKYLRESGYLEYLDEKQRNKVFTIMRRMMSK